MLTLADAPVGYDEVIGSHFRVIARIWLKACVSAGSCDSSQHQTRLTNFYTR